MSKHHYDRFSTIPTQFQATPHEGLINSLALNSGSHGHWRKRDGSNDGLIRFYGKVLEEDVAHYLAILDGDQGDDHGSICPKAIHEFGFCTAVKCLPVQVTGGIMVGGIFFTDHERWHTP